MFLNKKTVVFLCILNLVFFTFAHNPQVLSLELNFCRTELLAKNNSAIKGSIYFQQFPYIFVMNLEVPQRQVSFQNSEGSYYVENNTVCDFKNGKNYLAQTCSDFNNWFKEDFGIPESGYAIRKLEKIGNQVCATLHYNGDGETPIAYVKMYRDSSGFYTRLSMFDIQDKLLADTKLCDYAQYNSFRYPGKIVTESFSEGKIVSKVELLLLNAKVNCHKKTDYENPEYTDPDIKEYVPVEKSELAEKPSSKKYMVSSTSIAVNEAYRFYKTFITNQDIPGCAFTPTCSGFMVQSVNAHGLFGIIEGLDRLKRCTKTEVKRNIYSRNKEGRIIEAVN